MGSRNLVDAAPTLRRGGSTLDKEHFWGDGFRITFTPHEIVFRLPGLSRQLIVAKELRVRDWNLRPKRRIRHDDIQASKRNGRLRWLEAREVPTGKGQRVHIEDIDGLIGFGGHAQTHRRGTNEEPIEVGAKEVRLDELAETFPDGAELLR